MPNTVPVNLHVLIYLILIGTIGLLLAPFHRSENWSTERLSAQGHTAKCRIQDSSQVSEASKFVLQKIILEPSLHCKDPGVGDEFCVCFCSIPSTWHRAYYKVRAQCPRIFVNEGNVVCLSLSHLKGETMLYTSLSLSPWHISAVSCTYLLVKFIIEWRSRKENTGRRSR